MLKNIILILVLLLILGLAVYAVIKAKKSGKKCIGCPESGCSSCSCGCGNKPNMK